MTKLSAVCIDVSDLDRATSFYCEAVGCSLERTGNSHNTLSVGGVTLHVSLKDPGTEATGARGNLRNYARHWTPVHLDFDVEDVDAAVVAVQRLGGTVEDVKKGDWGTAAFCADPFGNGFCLLALQGE